MATLRPPRRPPLRPPLRPPRLPPFPNSCAFKDSPAAVSTKAGFEGAKNLYKFILGSISQDDPIHSQLQKASVWQLGQVKKLYDQAITLNRADTKRVRKLFFATKLGFLKLEIAAADAMLKKGLPKFPWLGKAISWVQTQWKKLQEMFHNMLGGGDSGAKPASPSAIAAQGAVATQHEDASEAFHFLDEHEARLTELDQHLTELADENADRCEL